MRAAFRVDASQTMGTGHVRRCMSLAQALTAIGAHTQFVCRQHDEVSAQVMPAHQSCLWLAPTHLAPTALDTQPTPYAHWGLVPWMQDADQTIAALHDNPPDWLVVDHYAWDARWHVRVRAALGCRLMVIDDLADRPLDADLLLDQNLHADHRIKYGLRIAPQARLLAGPRYALLSARYATATRYQFSETVRSIGIFMGGTDPDDLSSKALLACREVARFTGEVVLISSTQSPHHAQRVALATQWPRTQVMCDLPDLSDFFAAHDLQIGAGGGAAWERCCLGAPTVAWAIAANQQAVLPQLAGLGALQLVESPASPNALGQTIANLIAHPLRREHLSHQASGLVDGLGSARVAAVLALSVRPDLSLRPATLDDEQRLLDWSNEHDTRLHAFDPRPITAETHAAWLRARLAQANTCVLLVAQAGNGVPMGTIRFERETETENWWLSYSLDPAFRRWGLARVLVEQGVKRMARHTGSTGCIKALVKPDNPASLKTFAALLFSETRMEHLGENVHCFQQSLVHL
jgi:UDP-2,4-diacetamido-2,4,6-trideoxy-beta-L-altropyranose hydrolase